MHTASERLFGRSVFGTTFISAYFTELATALSSVANAKIDLLPVYYQTGQEAHCPFSRALDNQPTIEALDHELVAQSSPRLNRFAVTRDLDSIINPRPRTSAIASCLS